MLSKEGAKKGYQLSRLLETKSAPPSSANSRDELITESARRQAVELGLGAPQSITAQPEGRGTELPVHHAISH